MIFEIDVRGNINTVTLPNTVSLTNGQTFETSWEDPSTFIALTHPFSSSKERARMMAIGELDYMRCKEQEARQWIRENPIAFAGLTLRRFSLFWFPPETIWSQQAQ